MKNLPKMICFDMDGTIADLYGVEGWLKDLRSENPRPYIEAKPMWDMETLATILNQLVQMGVEIRVITWLSKDSTEKYKDIVRQAKLEWLKKYNFPYSHFHGIEYGRTKADSIRKYLNKGESAILIDDNAKVRKGWNMGETVNPEEIDIIKALAQIKVYE